ncbi:carboxymuconolactone decarboxylase family protein [Methanogenium marinum]|uniref:Carboxymuconolactone decarboxylase family protein n=1 Tax=Methanogenium marinum TaxID=348610 RepID=A0A9Q4PWS7_9EURY|nr:carboxymuconolactone decarboxylase family protein [Methanogenium marinum]MDE4908979.1 carboxymuconolactone decarboxylase family protein [Methanogenium marinum]
MAHTVDFEDTLQEILKRGTETAAKDWLEGIQEEYDSVPLIYQKMSKKPEVLLSHLMFKDAITETSSIDPKMIELISIAVGAALNCNHCVEYHMSAALKKGATKDEILEVVLIAGSLAQAAVLADAYRIIDTGTTNGCGASCEVNGVKLKKNGE